MTFNQSYAWGRLEERTRARDLVVGAEDRRLKMDSSIAAERARCLRGLSMSERENRSERAEEWAMSDTTLSSRAGGVGGAIEQAFSQRGSTEG